jgi:hypothetical protein
LLAEHLQTSTDPVPLVPLLIPVQRLAILLRRNGLSASDSRDLIKSFIEFEFSDGVRRMLLQVCT